MNRERAVFGSDLSVPHRLRERADKLLEAGDASSARTLIEAAIKAASGAINAGSGDRDAALEVLVADALATHAMEVLVEQPERFEASCDAAMQRLAEIVGEQ